MKKQLHTLFFVLLFCPPFFTATINAQTAQRTCYSHIALQQQLAQDPQMQERLTNIERFTTQFTSKTVETRGKNAIVIPVIVHVIYRNATENISENQIRSQIDVLNKDYNKENIDLNKVPTEFAGLVADCDIRFQLAARTPEGIATNGIVRHATTHGDWGGSDDIKRPAKGGFAPWDASKYLNIYVATLGGGILGYASFPGAAATNDGIVIDPSVFGTTGTARKPFNLGRTCVHEVGHWLNLFHIWGDSDCGDDHCNDTPAQKDAHFGNVTSPQYSNCNGTTTRDMSMNFMDYVNDEAMQMFTGNQKARMQAVLNGVRSTLLTSDGCVPPTQSPCKVTDLTIKETKTTSATATWTAVSTATNYNIEIKLANDKTWTTTQSTTNSFIFNNLQSSENYNVRVKANCSNVDDSNEIIFTTKNTTIGMDDFENNNSKTEAHEIKINTTISALIGDATDLDWFWVKTTTEQPNIQIALSNLAADYDIRIYDATGKLIRYSAQKDLNNEVISINASYASTYFIQVYGYNGASDAYNSYNLSTTSANTPFLISYVEAKKTTNLSENSFQIYPNPVEHDANFRFDLRNDSKVNIQIFDLQGVVRYQMTENVSKANPSVSLDLTSLPSGTYMVAAEKDGERMVQKMIKM